MPVLEATLVDYLTTELSPLVGDRIVPLRGEEGITLPYVVHQRVSATRDNDHDGFGTMRAWVEPRIQFKVWDRTAAGAITVAEALVEALNGYHGNMGGLYLGHVRAVHEADGYQEDVKLYWRIVDFMVPHQEGGGS